ncbi:MAG: BNR-repeat neuraminidase N-terminal domain-containing protein, partial [Dolichospermum sp.]
MVLVCFALSFFARGQVTVSGASTGNGSYTTLGAAFTAIASATGTININITGNTTEGTTALSLAAGTWTSITIAPTGGPWTITGNPSGGTAMVTFNGSDNVTINGGNNLIFSNTTVSSTSGTATFRLLADATNNTFNNVTFLTASTMAAGTNGGAVWISTGTTTGNDNNSFQSCKFSSSTSNSGVLFYASGSTTNNTIQNSSVTVNNCEAYDYYLASGTQAGIYISTGNTNYAITNNKIYQSATRNITTSSTVYGIYCVNTGATALGENFTITGNTIGYANNSGTGTMTYTANATAGGFTGILMNHSSTSTGTSMANNNTISNIQWTSTSTSTFNGLNQSTTSTTVGNTYQFNSNTVQNITWTNATGGVQGISVSYSPSMTVSSNTINNISRSGSGVFYGILYTGTTSSSLTFNNNNITNLSSTSTSSTSNFIGIYSTSSPAIETWTGNTIDGLTSSSTANQTVAGIYNLTATTGNKTCQNNIVRNISSASTTTGSVYGLRIAYLGATNLISGNTVYNISGGTTLMGIAVGQSSGATSANTSVYKNKVYDLSASGTGSTVFGFQFGASLGTSSTTNVYNNYVGNLSSTATSSTSDAIRGISITSTATTSNIYLHYNTVYLTGSASSGTDFATSAVFHTYSATSTTASLTMKNNIFVNNYPSKGVGVSASFKRSAATDLNNFSTNSSNNLYRGANIYYDGTNTDVSMSAYSTRVGARATASFSENPTWVSTTGSSSSFLHIDPTVPTQIEAGGTPITTPISITDDFDADTRDVTTPDVGADEGSFTVAIPMTYASSTTEQVTGIAYAGAINQSIIRVKVVTTGATSPISLTQLTLNANGTTAIGDIDAATAKVYYTGNSTTFSIGSLFGATTPTIGNYNVNGSQVLAEGDNYFWVAYDVNAAATSGNFIDGECVDLVVDGNSESPTITAPTGNKSILGQMSGTYNIGASQTFPHFTNLTTAISDLHNRGVSAAVTFALQSDYSSSGETFPLTINSITGASAANTITIKPAASVTATITGSINSSSILRLNGADYIIIDGSNSGGTDRSLTIENTTTTTSGNAVIWLCSPLLTNGATNNIIRNCVIQGNSATTTFTGIHVGGTGSIGLTSAGVAQNSNNLFNNNLFRKTQYGISLFGYSTTALDQNNVISNNNFGTSVSGEGFALLGINADRQQNLIISGNEVQNVTNSTYTSSNPFGGIRLLDFKDGLCYKNKVHDLAYTGTSTPKIYGIAMTNSTFNSSGNPSNAQIYNNVVYKITSTGTSAVWNTTGILASAGYGDKIYFNSVSLTGQVANSSSGLVAAFANGDGNITSNGSNIEVINNIFSLTGSSGIAGGNFWAYYTSATTLAGSTLNYNTLYCNGTNATNNVGRYNSSNSATLTAWQTSTSQEANSISSDPLFNSSTNLIPQAGSPVITAGVDGTGFTDDYNGVTRTNPPTMGAYDVAGDFAGPIITYTNLTNEVAASSRTVTSFATITDVSGVNTTSGTNPRLYYKKSTDANAFVGNTSGNNGWKYVEATNATSPFDFTIDYSIINGGSVTTGNTIQYFVAAQDLASTPNVGISNSLVFAGNATPASVNLQGSGVTSITGTPQQYSITAGISGTITIPGTYPSLTLAGGAFEAINNAVVTGNINIEIAGNLTSETGANALNQFNSPHTIKIYPTTTARTISGAASGSALIKLNGADRVTIDGSIGGTGTDKSLTITNTATTNNTTTIWLASLGTGTGANTNTVKNCNISTGVIGTSSINSYGIHLSGTTIGSNGDDNDDVTIENNTITKAGTGIYAKANSTGLLNNLTITNNIIGADIATDYVNRIGIDITQSTGATISLNTIKNVLINTGGVSAINNARGILIGTGVVSSTITKNNISNVGHNGTQGYGGKGIDITTGSLTSSLTLSNNVISSISGDGWSDLTGDAIVGIRILSGTGGINLYNNSVNLGTGSYAGNSSGTQAACLFVGATSGSLDIRNNIFSSNLDNSNAVGKVWAINSAAANTVFTSINYNNYFVSGAEGVLGFLTLDRTNLAGIVTGFGGNANSYNADPGFTSTTNLLPVANVFPSNYRLGTNISGITTDFAGTTRSNP